MDFKLYKYVNRFEKLLYMDHLERFRSTFCFEGHNIAPFDGVVHSSSTRVIPVGLIACRGYILAIF